MWGVSAGRLEPVRTCRATRLEMRVRIAATVAAIFLVVTVDSLISADTPDVRAVPYASRFGGSAYDTITDVAVDNHGNVYLTGSTRSADFPLREPFQSAIGGDEGKSTAFVAKISPSGNLIFSTYFGGSGSDSGNQIAVDGDRAVFVAGGTTSPNLPTTTGVIQPAPACPNEVPWCRDAFLMKLTPAGRLVTATYFGHGSTDVTGLAVDAGGDIYLAGTARERLDQSGRPVPSHVRGGYHAFIAKLSGDATTYRYVAHIGPSATSTVSALGVDRRGRAYIGGKDSSCRVQATPGAFTTPDGCLFVARLASEEGSVEWLSRFGGTDVIQLDPDLEDANYRPGGRR
jgi:Beta-propeller repeat